MNTSQRRLFYIRKMPLTKEKEMLIKELFQVNLMERGRERVCLSERNGSAFCSFLSLSLSLSLSFAGVSSLWKMFLLI